MDKKYDHKASEQLVKEQWEQNNTYATSNNPGPLFSIDTPPPTVSGSLHIGHIFSYTQADIIARFQRMSGKSVFYPFGFDDNGLPTERFVEKQKKISGHSLPRSEFVKLCLEATHEAEEQFKELWQTMGLSIDWSKWYSTISPSSQKIAQESFIRLYNKEYIYRKDEPALYCVACRTTVAQAELDDFEMPSTFNDIVFKDNAGNDLIIATTRPELLPACVALLYHPDDKRYQHLKGTEATVPLFGHTVPVLEDDLVQIDKGTGLVMVCTFGDKTDVEWYKKHKLPYRPAVGRDGKWVASTGVLAGLKAKDARTLILEELKKHELLINQKNISHAVNVHERCKKEIEYLVLPQWFLSVLEHKKTFLDLADTINWYPSFMQSRYRDWVENIGWDWCISRQRFYGIPFPAWHCTSCNEVLLADIKDLPIDPQETPYPGTACPACKSTDIVADTDVMDTWNTSSLTPYICYNLFDPDVDVFSEQATKTFLPMSMRPQAHDIIRTWAFYTVVKTWMHHGVIPWKDIVISGHVLTDGKEKISKSRGNAPWAPENLLKRFPADVIRYWTASGNLGHDVSFSENQLKIGLKLVTKLWNAFKFIHMNLAEYTPTEQPQSLGTLNEWLLNNASATTAYYTKQFEQHEFSLALNKLEEFFWNDFCDTYLELIKDMLFNPEKYDADDVAATRWTLYTVGLRLLQLFAPYVPFITEKLYQTLYQQHVGSTSLHQTRFADVQKQYDFTSSTQTMQIALNIISAVRKLKTAEQLSLRTPLTALRIYSTDQNVLDVAQALSTLISGVTQAEKIEFMLKELPASSLKQEQDEQWHAQVRYDSD